jgi:hypothetical protein
MRRSEHAATVGGVVEAGVGLLAFWRATRFFGRALADFIHSEVGHAVGPAGSARREEVGVQSAQREEVVDALILIPAARSPFHVEIFVSQPIFNCFTTELSCVYYQPSHSQRVARKQLRPFWIE